MQRSFARPARYISFSGQRQTKLGQVSGKYNVLYMHIFQILGVGGELHTGTLQGTGGHLTARDRSPNPGPGQSAISKSNIHSHAKSRICKLEKSRL